MAGTEEERSLAVREAALEPKVYRQIWDRFDGDLPSDENLTSRLVLDWDFNKDSVPGFIKDLRATIEFAKLDKDDKLSGDNEQIAKDDEHIHRPAFHSGSAQVTRSTGHIPPVYQKPQMSTDTMLPIPLEIGDAFIPRGMSDDDFDLLLDSLKLWKRRIVKSEWPKHAIWRNSDHDQPVTITGVMGDQDGIKYFKSSSGTGIPETELEFQ